MPILIRILEIIVIVLMGVVTTIVIAEVFLRGLADTSLIITDELSRYLMIWTAMLAAALLVYEDGHIRTTILADALPANAAMILYIASEFVVLCFLALVVVSSLMLMPSVLEQHTVTLGVSMAWFHAALPVSAALMFILTARAIIVRVKKRMGSN